MARRGVDVALVQEPYTCLNQHGKRVLPSIARSSRVAMSSVDDETGRVSSAIVVVGSDINCMCLSHLSDNYFSVMVIDRYSSGEVQSSATTAGLGSTGSGDDMSSSATPAGQGSTRSSDSTRSMRKPLVLISGYFKFNKPIEPMIERLSEIMRVLGGFEVIFGGDINARSELWHDARARDCPKGLAFENFLAETRLVLLNLPGWPSTYCNTLGESNIDVTLVNSRSLHQRVRGWHVETGLITSDHRVIGFEIVGWGPSVPDAPRFIIKDVDWGRFRATLARHLNDTPLTRYDDPLRDIDSRVRGLTKAYQQSCGEVLKASRPVKFLGTVWWNQKLEDEKRRVNRARRRLQRARDPVAREVLLARWRKLRDQYGKSTDAGDYTLTVEEAVGQYLNTLIPGNEADGPAIENRLDEIVREARLEQENGMRGDGAGEVDRGDVLMAIEVMNKNKAPGADRIPGIAIKKTMDQVLYGIGVWGDALSRVKVRRRLLTLQRHCGIGIAGCKFSVSHPVTQLLASEPPLDLVAQERVVIERLKKGWIQTGTYLGREYRIDERTNANAVKRSLREATLVEWESRWRDDPRGRHTRKYFPTVESRLGLKIQFTRQLTEILTGHGFFREYKHRILHDGNGKCPECDVMDHPEHRILACRRFDEERENLRRACYDQMPDVPWPPGFDRMVQFPSVRKALESFARHGEDRPVR
ncbi:hypothetical protein M8J77_025956 [Diaphorina citri]|nr:hypothetical protein M8J77_025956 [Diaphorina citri]